MELADSTDGISQRDLVGASEFFAGLNFVHLNFEHVAGRNRSQEKTLTPRDLHEWLRTQGGGADESVKRGVERLAKHLQHLESLHAGTAVTDAELMKMQLPGE